MNNSIFGASKTTLQILFWLVFTTDKPYATYFRLIKHSREKYFIHCKRQHDKMLESNFGKRIVHFFLCFFSPSNFSSNVTCSNWHFARLNKAQSQRKKRNCIRNTVMRGYRIYNNQGNGHFTPSERVHAYTITMVTYKNWTTKNVPTTKSNSFVNGSNFYKRYHISLIQMDR